MRSVIARALNPRVDALDAQRELTVAMKVFLAFCGACFMALVAHVRIPLFFTPVPMTGQVFGVLVCGALLGGRYGALSQAFYIGLAALGVGWMSTGAVGAAVLMGLTSGYLYGFIAAACLLGWMTRRFRSLRTYGGQIWAMLAAVTAIYACAAVYMTLVLGMSFGQAVTLGVVPFIFVDMLKTLVAAAITSRLLSQ